MTVKTMRIMLLGFPFLLACESTAPTSAPTTIATTDSPASSSPASPSPEDSLTGFATTGIVLYQPDSVLELRVPSSTVLANYIKQLQAVCAAQFLNVTTPEALDIVVAVKPGKLSRVWFVSSSRSDSDAFLIDLKGKLEVIPPLDVRGGPIAFAIIGSVAGEHRERQGGPNYKPPLPKTWLEAATKSGGHGVLPDDTLRVVWP